MRGYDQRSEISFCGDCSSCFRRKHIDRGAVYQKIQMAKEGTWLFDICIIYPRYFDCYLLALSAIVRP